MTHTDASRAFVRSIAEQPDEDTPRLAYADYLDEHGLDPARAELIRVQCFLRTYPPAVEGPPPGSDDFDVWKLGKMYQIRERELIAENEARWRGGPVCGECGGHGDRYGGVLDLSRPEDARKFGCSSCSATGDLGGLSGRCGPCQGSGEGFSSASTCVFCHGSGWRCRAVTFRRGFIRHAVTAMIGDLVERYCLGCGACAYAVSGWLTCTCVSGRAVEWRPTPLLRQIVTATDDHPERALIDEVIPDDRVPHVSADDAVFSWAPIVGGANPGPPNWRLPGPVWARLDGSDKRDYAYASYPTRADAYSALGRALVTWAREWLSRPSPS
jgi:uncharacterized protein (TIGR02996 family)